MKNQVDINIVASVIERILSEREGTQVKVTIKPKEETA